MCRATQRQTHRHMHTETHMDTHIHTEKHGDTQTHTDTHTDLNTDPHRKTHGHRHTENSRRVLITTSLYSFCANFHTRLHTHDILTKLKPVYMPLGIFPHFLL